MLNRRSVYRRSHQITTHGCYVSKTGNAAMPVNKGRRGNDIRITPQYQKRCIRVLAWMRFIERRIHDGGGDSRELANASASINAHSVQGVRKPVLREATHVSFTPDRFGQDVASSMIKSESRSIPALAPGSVYSAHGSTIAVWENERAPHNCIL